MPNLKKFKEFCHNFLWFFCPHIPYIYIQEKYDKYDITLCDRGGVGLPCFDRWKTKPNNSKEECNALMTYL